MSEETKSITQTRKELIESLREQYGEDADRLGELMIRYELAKRKWQARKNMKKFLGGTPKMSRIARQMNVLITKHEAEEDIDVSK